MNLSVDYVTVIIHWASQIAAAIVSILVLCFTIIAFVDSIKNNDFPSVILAYCLLVFIFFIDLGLNPTLIIWHHWDLENIPNYPTVFFLKNYWVIYFFVLAINLLICLLHKDTRKYIPQSICPLILLTSLIGAAWAVKIVESLHDLSVAAYHPALLVPACLLVFALLVVIISPLVMLIVALGSKHR